jgi:hypothetical protein
LPFLTAMNAMQRFSVTSTPIAAMLSPSAPLSNGATPARIIPPMIVAMITASTDSRPCSAQ